MENKFNSRRNFLKAASFSTVAVATGMTPVFAHEPMTPQHPLRKGSILKITPDPEKTVFKPLDDITVSGLKKESYGRLTATAISFCRNRSIKRLSVLKQLERWVSIPFCY